MRRQLARTGSGGSLLGTPALDARQLGAVMAPCQHTGLLHKSYLPNGAHFADVYSPQLQKHCDARTRHPGRDWRCWLAVITGQSSGPVVGCDGFSLSAVPSGGSTSLQEEH